MVLDGFDTTESTHDAITRVVFTRGSGSAVVIMHEIPGITPPVAEFARRVADDGFKVYMPLMFGTPGKGMTAGYAFGQMARACISREFSVLSRNESSPITNWLRGLCREAFAECGGRGVGAIGMCLTGNFALALMVDECVMAPVLSQPSLPFPVSPSHRKSLHLSGEDLAVVKRRTQEGCGVLGLRFTHDPMCPGDRFQRLREELDTGFEAIEIDSGPDNDHGIASSAHSVVTTDLVDEEGHPTQVALHRVLELFRERLRTP
ncbi:dienelactone hydrolase family protein [Myxococcota bacterium]|nr:dienelactone hydrolase family protein [Myxococcota bacterium]